jgi:glycosyltransferase involved in cell wall biosynthesis
MKNSEGFITNQPTAFSFQVIRVYFRLPPEPGGMEAHIAHLSLAQRELGVEVVNLFNIGKAEGLGVQIFAETNLSDIRPAALRNLIFYSGALAAHSRLHSNVPTILHVHGDWSDFLYSKVLARWLGAKLIVASVHDTVAKPKSFLYSWALSHCHLVFATGKDDQIFLQELLDRPVHHLPSAPVDDFFELPSGETHKSCDVISVGDFFQKKRHDLILECAHRRPNLRFAVYGDGPEREGIVARAEAENLRNIIFPGRCPPSQIIKAMHGAKMFLSTSAREGTPTAALEAFAIGLPVVLTPSNDYSWLVEPGVNGFVTKSWELDEIIACIDDVLEDESRRVAMGVANRERARNHTWHANAERVTAMMYEQFALVRNTSCAV